MVVAPWALRSRTFGCALQTGVGPAPCTSMHAHASSPPTHTPTRAILVNP